MIQEDKDLLLKDLYTRLPYGVKVLVKDSNGREYNFKLDSAEIFLLEKVNTNVKPYLRPMSNIIEDGILKLSGEVHCNLTWNTENITDTLTLLDNSSLIINIKAIDWLNAHHFDYRGLIEKGLALEAPEGMYNVK